MTFGPLSVGACVAHRNRPVGGVAVLAAVLFGVGCGDLRFDVVDGVAEPAPTIEAVAEEASEPTPSPPQTSPSLAAVPEPPPAVRRIADGGVELIADSGAPDSGASVIVDRDPLRPWTAAPLYTASFSSWIYSDEFVRHRDSEGFITLIDPDTIDAPDATFEVIPGLRDKLCLSFRAINGTSEFLRHAQSRVRLQSVDTDTDTPLLLGDATWCPVPGLADPEAISFQAYNYPDRYLHVRNRSELWIDDWVDSPEFASEATFLRYEPFVVVE